MAPTPRGKHRTTPALLIGDFESTHHEYSGEPDGFGHFRRVSRCIHGTPSGHTRRFQLRRYDAEMLSFFSDWLGLSPQSASGSSWNADASFTPGGDKWKSRGAHTWTLMSRRSSFVSPHKHVLVCRKKVHGMYRSQAGRPSHLICVVTKHASLHGSTSATTDQGQTGSSHQAMHSTLKRSKLTMLAKDSSASTRLPQAQTDGDAVVEPLG
jgi:hypothetical protein